MRSLGVRGAGKYAAVALDALLSPAHVLPLRGYALVGAHFGFVMPGHIDEDIRTYTAVAIRVGVYPEYPSRYTSTGCHGVRSLL